MTQSNTTDLLDAVRRDHREIESLMSMVDTATGDARRDAFEDLVRKLAVHETAEEEVVHPLAKGAGAKDVVDEVLNEETTAKKALSALDGMDVNSPGFETQFEKLKIDVKRHAEYEEQQEHPRIRAEVPADKLERAAKMFDFAEKTAPTRPHPSGPESRGGNLVLGPIFAIADRVRDAVRDAMKKS
jgi:hemerythrin superfamily protein